MLGLGIDLFQRGAGGAAETLLFNAVTWSGTGGAQSITGVGFQPDFVWAKARNQVAGHNVYDVVRGVNKVIFPSATAAESDRTVAGGSLVSFDDDGFSVGTDSGTTTGLSNSGYNYVAWCWKAGGTAVTNTDGSVNSQVSANVDAGFSVVGYTGTGSTATIGHGLSQAPEVMIVKNRSATSNWCVYAKPIADISVNNILFLDATNAVFSNSTVYGASPTSTVFTVQTNPAVNGSGDNCIAYCFHSVEGLIKIGTYSGTGADQAITGVGFQPAVVIAKRTDSTGNWVIADDVRLTAGESHFLYPNLTNAESASAVFTMESDGFSMDGSGVDYNASGGTYLYIAIKGVD